MTSNLQCSNNQWPMFEGGDFRPSLDIAEFKIAVRHRLGYFQQYVKISGPFSDHLINILHTKSTRLHKIVIYFVNSQTLVEVFDHLSMYCPFLILNCDIVYDFAILFPLQCFKMFM